MFHETIVFPSNCEFSHSLIIMKQPRNTIILTTELLKFIIGCFSESLSITSVVNVCSYLWKSHGVTSNFISNKSVRKLLISFGWNIMHPLVRNQQKQFSKENTESLSCDHTYKSVKKLMVSQKGKKKVNFKFNILNTVTRCMLKHNC